MIDRIKNIFARLCIDDYLIRELTRESLEMYFVKKALDTKRSVKTTDYTLTVYRSFTEGECEYRGSSEVLVFPSMTDDEIEKKIADGYASATHVRAMTYPAAPVVCDVRERSEESLSRLCRGYAEALYRYDTEADAFVNSAELFCTSTYTRIITSHGIDVAYPSLEASGEIVVQCKGESDVELFDYFRYEGEQYDALSERVRGKLNAVRDRARATRDLPSGEYSIILSGECVRTMLGYALFLADAKNVHTGYSDGRIADGVKAVFPDLELVPTVPYSREGIRMQERALVRDGELCTLVGGMRHATYLGAEPTGEYERIRAESGAYPLELLASIPCVYIDSFSDFQFDELDGYFGGEVRLGYYYDGERVRAVTGFSVSGNIRSVGKVRYSRERYSDYTYEGPACMMIDGVSIAGN